MNPASDSRGRSAWAAEAALIAVTLIWGVSFTLVKEALADASTVVFLAIRFTVAAAALAVFSRRTLLSGTLLSDRLAWQGGWRAGLCLAVAYLCQTSGLRWTTPSKSAFLTALCTVLVPLLAACLHRSPPRGAEMGGLGMAMTGMALLTGFTGAEARAMSTGEALTIACAFAFAAHILVTGRYAGHAGLNAFSLWQLVVAATLFWAAMPWLEPVKLRLTWRLVAAIAVTGIVCTAAAFTIQAWAQRRTSAARVALIFSLEPVSAAASSWALGGEKLPFSGILGAALILGGVLLVELTPRRPGRYVSNDGPSIHS